MTYRFITFHTKIIIFCAHSLSTSQWTLFSQNVFLSVTMLHIAYMLQDLIYRDFMPVYWSPSSRWVLFTDCDVHLYCASQFSQYFLLLQAQFLLVTSWIMFSWQHVDTIIIIHVCGFVQELLTLQVLYLCYIIFIYYIIIMLCILYYYYIIYIYIIILLLYFWLY